MSEDTNSTSICASCGIAGIDNIKLKECDGCDLVKYCSDECQRDHKLEHEEECKKRAAELRDELLFKQPESTYLGDCPICMIPLPPDISKSTIASCCSKVICGGCIYSNQVRAAEMRLKERCPFCRVPRPKTDEENEKLKIKRIKANDPVAMWQKGTALHVEGDHTSACELYSKAAELGNVQAHCKLAVMYHLGRGVEKDEGKEIHHAEEAAVAGHPYARCLLGLYEIQKGNTERAVKHWIIGATQGCDDSMEALMEAFKDGCVSKEDLAATLRAHQAAVDATKSPQREAALRNELL